MLSDQWVYFRAGQRIRCDRKVWPNGRRVEARDPDRRLSFRRCERLLLAVGSDRAVRIRVVEDERVEGHYIRCACSTSYEFEEIPIIPIQAVGP